MGSRARRLAGDLARFLTVGGLATAVSLLGFNGLVHGIGIGSAPMRDLPIPAYVLANVVAGGVAYLGMRAWAFRDRATRGRVAGAVRFFTLGGATMLIPVACLAVSRYGLGLTDAWADNLSANVVGLALGTAARFWVFRRYVFVATPHYRGGGATAAGADTRGSSHSTAEVGPGGGTA